MNMSLWLERLTCIWRLYEVQAFLIQLVSQFEFAPSDDDSKIRKTYFGFMAPTLEGDETAITLPLKVSLASPDL